MSKKTSARKASELSDLLNDVTLKLIKHIYKTKDKKLIELWEKYDSLLSKKLDIIETNLELLEKRLGI